MTNTAAVKAAPRLNLADRIDIIKNKRMFSLAFPLSILILLILIFGLATGGAFFRASVLKGLFDQTLIIGTMATDVSFIYTTGNLDISVGSALKVEFQLCKMLEDGGFRYGAFILYFIVCLLVFHFTAIGRQLRFIGGNQKCAEQTGMNPKKAIYTSFLMAGIGIGIAAVFTIIRTGSMGNSTGNGMGMDVMLATVLGGMSIFGGAKSNTYSGIIGALTVSTLNKGLLMLGVSSTVIQGVRGVIFLLLVFLNSERPNTLPAREQF